MKTKLTILFSGVALLLAGCNHIGGTAISGSHNSSTGETSGTIEVTFKDENGNTIVRKYPVNHPAIQHLRANP